MPDEKTPSGDTESAGGSTRMIPHWRMILQQGVLTPAIEKHNYNGSGTEEDPYSVEWLDNDPRNPMLFPIWYKWLLTITMAFATLAVSLCSSAFSGGLSQLIREFHSSQEVATLGLSLFVLGFAVGPLFWAPMSELFGRQLLYFGTFAAFTAFNAGVPGAKNMWTVLILRFFAGSFGSSPLTNAGGVIADCFPARQRGLATSVFAGAPFLGPALGPIIGGFLGQAGGWRWLTGFLAAFSGLCWIMGSLLVPETYSPVLLRKRAKALSKKTGKVYESKLDIERGKVTIGDAFKTALSRPWILLFKEPIVLILSIYMAIIYGTLYMLFGAYPIVYQQGRGWSQGIGGLAFIGVLIGMIIAVAYSCSYDNHRYQKVVDESGGFASPEARLPPAILGGVALTVGLFWFAWTNSPSLPWAASMAAGIPFGFGMVLVFLAILNYLIDAYTIFAASVLAANSVLRSCFGAAFPLFTTQMYHRLGIHWASSIPAFLALACVPFPFLFYKYGKSIRMKCKYAAESEAFMKKIRGEQEDDTTSSDSKPSIDPEKDADDQEDKEKLHKSSQAARMEREAEEEREAIDYSYEEPDFEHGGTHPPRFERIKTATEGQREYESNPYDIDRVNTRESFKRTTSRSSTGTSLKKTKSGRSFRW
ncbi:MFS general substrate transporter [Venturia nashicola]|uniref:MFS general substrate transporter n=1 Tax=Venturia nashicola TaxID=86259 RepID=A0A4Z1NYC8_9PEZI|nr:MFS general substrate transporter [Venturia nashicola]